MEDLGSFFVVAGVYHLIISVLAGVVGEPRTCGFGWAFLGGLYYFVLRTSAT